MSRLIGFLSDQQIQRYRIERHISHERIKAVHTEDRHQEKDNASHEHYRAEHEDPVLILAEDIKDKDADGKEHQCEHVKDYVLTDKSFCFLYHARQRKEPFPAR